MLASHAHIKAAIIAARHAPLTAQIEALRQTVRANPQVWELLQALPDDCWIGAGAIIQNVWNCLGDRPWNFGIKDVDVLYFDPDDLSKQSEQTRTQEYRMLTDAFTLDVVNAARIHLWYEEVFGKRIAPYTSVAHSISSWPTLCSMVAVNLTDDVFHVIAPSGFHDLFCGIIRPNKLLITEQIYMSKATRWQHTWPWLTVLDWHTDEIAHFSPA